MKASLNWLNQYLQYPISAKQAAEILTQTGLEVENVSTINSNPNGLDGVVIGKVIEKEKHPDADRLSITKVDVGGDLLLQIVCGAPNVEIGQTVVVATIGTALSTSKGRVEIKKSKIRGVESQGMICAEDEIGIGNSHDGIIVLSDSIEPGTPASAYYDKISDTVMELNITPNRVDATSHIGIARDISAYMAVHGKPNSLQIPAIANTDYKYNQTTLIHVSVGNAKACPRYAGAYIRNIKVAPSPDWIQEKLISIGLKPINNIVDITNYVLFETGHPLHAFDVSSITGKQIIIRLANKDEKIVTLDSIERQLYPDDLVICDTEKPLCIAGVYGGINSGVKNTTTDIFIESAYFSPEFIRRTAKRQGLHTDASFRFERGADIQQVDFALRRVIDLIVEITGGYVDGSLIDILSEPINLCEISLHWDYLNQISGIHLSQDICLQILTSLGFHITYKDEKLVTVTVPSAKVDVRREVDLVEEILRIYGYDKIPLGNTLTAVLKNEPELPLRTYRNKTAEFLISNGFNESVTLSLDHSIYYPSSNELVFVENPISSELDIMRPTLLFSMLKSAAHNINRRSTRLRFFEFGRTYIKKASNPYAEKPMLGLLMTGEEHPDAWYHTKQKVDFHSIYGVCTSILSRVGVNQRCLEINKQPPFYYETAFNSYADEKQTTLLYTCGKIAAAVLKKIDIKQEIWFAEIHWNHILENRSFHHPHFTDLPKFPLVIRDLAMLIDLSVSYKQIENLVRKLFNEKLYDLTLFDVYEGKNIPKGKKSYAIRLTLYNAEKTFTDKEVDEMIQKLITTLTQSLGAEIRSNL